MDCIFCKIANGEIASDTVYEDDNFRVILDLSPASKGHMLILPKVHAGDITELSEDIAGKALVLAGKLGKAAMVGLGATGFNTLANTGESAGQTVFHCHIHVIPRYDDASSIVSWLKQPIKKSRRRPQRKYQRVLDDGTWNK